MRQIGGLCAAALVAIKENAQKLEDDHKKAKVLAGISFLLVIVISHYALSQANLDFVYSNCINFSFPCIKSEGLNRLKGLSVDIESVETNIVSI